MARQNSQKRTFVWARQAGVVGPGAANPGFTADILSTVRDRHGEGVLRGATVMAIRGYARPNPQGDTEPRRFRVGIRVSTAGELLGTTVEQREGSPLSSPEADWMLFQQYLTISPEGFVNPPGSSARGTPWSVETQAARRFTELGLTLGLWMDVADTIGNQLNNGVIDYDLSIGLKLP